MSVKVKTAEEALLGLAKSRLLALERALPLLMEDYAGHPEARAILLKLKSAVRSALEELEGVGVPKSVKVPSIHEETALYDAALLAEDAAEYLLSTGMERHARRLAELSKSLEELAYEVGELGRGAAPL